jgi:hypothetical protein
MAHKNYWEMKIMYYKIITLVVIYMIISCGFIKKNFTGEYYTMINNYVSYYNSTHFSELAPFRLKIYKSKLFYSGEVTIERRYLDGPKLTIIGEKYILTSANISGDTLKYIGWYGLYHNIEGMLVKRKDSIIHFIDLSIAYKYDKNKKFNPLFIKEDSSYYCYRNCSGSESIKDSIYKEYYRNMYRYAAICRNNNKSIYDELMLELDCLKKNVRDLKY